MLELVLHGLQVFLPGGRRSCQLASQPCRIQAQAYEGLRHRVMEFPCQVGPFSFLEGLQPPHKGPQLGVRLAQRRGPTLDEPLALCR
jgi:hypothetical protein